MITLYATFQCSLSCGVGQQQRLVNCVSEQDLAIVPNSLCEKISKPETLRKCNMQECKTHTSKYTMFNLSLCLSGLVEDLKSRSTISTGAHCLWSMIFCFLFVMGDLVKLENLVLQIIALQCFMALDN